jgi:hypothetical protein
MATVEEVKQLRLMVAEPDDTTYTDEMLGVLIDSYGTASLPLAEAAYRVWTNKAASYAELVDISEGGSQRKNGDLHKRALTMAGIFKSEIDADASLSQRTVIARLAR